MGFDVPLERFPVVLADGDVFAVAYENPAFYVAPDTL